MTMENNFDRMSEVEEIPCRDCYYNPQCKKCETCLEHCECDK